MRFALSTNTLNNIKQLTRAAAHASEAFQLIDEKLTDLQLLAYQTRTTVETNSMALGDSPLVKTKRTLPGNFRLKHSSVIAEFDTLKQAYSDAQANLRSYKVIALDELAIKKVKEYEKLSQQLADVHSFLGAMEKSKGGFNTGLWNKIRIPAGINISRLRQRADNPHGAAMLHYDYKAEKLMDVVSKEITEFLTN